MRDERMPCAAQRLDGNSVHGGFRPERGKRQMPALRSLFARRPIGVRSTLPPLQEHRSLRPIHAKQLTSEGATLQSP